MTRVIVADDDDAVRSMLTRQLRRSDYEVAEAATGLEACQLLEASEFDVVVSDMKMPVMDGMGLLAKSREIAPDTEFVILTGHGSLENAVEAFRTGNLFDYLTKPLNDIREFEAVVSRAAERKRLRLENRRLVEDLNRMAEQDGLTGLLDHRTILARLEEAVAGAAGSTVAVALMDMDGFRMINETYGHPVGDLALKHFADALRATLGDRGLVGRCGGDEFMAVFPGATSVAAAQIVTEVRAHLDANRFASPAGIDIPVYLSCGIVDTDSPARSPANLVAAADAALYEGKRRGGDIVVRHLHDGELGDDARTGFDVLDSLVTAIDTKDRYTRRHSEDVADCALLLGGALGLSMESTGALRVAALLHDVGKIGVPDSVLRKSGTLTDEEFETMKGHVTVSALIIHGIPRLADVVEAVSSHHERWDGSGYPNGLKGEQIPLLGRIMAIADSFSAMTTSRPYRCRLTVEQALRELESCAGAQFDPDLTRAFVDRMRAQERAGKRKAA